MSLNSSSIAYAVANQSAGVFNVQHVFPEQRALGSNVIAFTPPSDVLVSRWYPGYRVSNFSDLAADETIARMLAPVMGRAENLRALREMLNSVEFPQKVTAELFRRPDVAVKQRAYMASEDAVRAAVIRSAAGFNAPAELVQAFALVFIRIFSKMELVRKDVPWHVIATAPSYVVSRAMMEQLVVADALRPMWDAARVDMIVRELDVAATPAVIGEVIARHFRTAAHLIPPLALNLRRLGTALNALMVLQYKEDALPLELSSHPSLRALAGIANFLLIDQGATFTVRAITEAVPEVRDSCDMLHRLLSAEPSIEMVSLKRYAAMFGTVPLTSPEGHRRGVVVYSASGQVPTMELVDMRKQAGGSVGASRVDPIYAPLSALSSTLSTSLANPSTLGALMNIVADELASMPTDSLEDAVAHHVATFRVSDADAKLLAMAQSNVLALGSDVVGDDFNELTPVLIYGVRVHEAWAMPLEAATGTTAYFTDPYRVLVYSSGAERSEATPFPSRPQHLGLTVASDKLFTEQILDAVDPYVIKPFNFLVPLRRQGREPIELRLAVSVVSDLLVTDADQTPDTGIYGATREIGLDAELAAMFELATAYARGTDKAYSDLAVSWLLQLLIPIARHPAVRDAGTVALNAALRAGSIDGRAYRASFSELTARTMIGVALGTLVRFNKLSPATAVGIIPVLPWSALSNSAAQELHSLPTPLDGRLALTIRT